jgi:hypothetical protein
MEKHARRVRRRSDPERTLTMLKNIGLLTLSVALGLCSVACGGDDDGGSSGGGSGGTASGGGGSGGTASGGGGSSNGGGGAGPITSCDDAADTASCTTCLDQAESFGQDRTDSLVVCSCASCADQLDACYNMADATDAANCRAVVECGQAAGCKGTECYCGVGVAIADCVSTGGTGDCKEEIAVAAGCENEATPTDEAACVAAARAEAGSAVALASAVGECTTGDPQLDPPAPGNCAGL